MKLGEGPIELTVGSPAAGGSCVARHDGRVVFVRHALPGERVLAQVTATGPKGRFWFADAVEIRTAAPGRVDPPCPFSGPGLCGGCDYQHVDLATQRRWKQDLIAEQLARLGGVEHDVVVDPVPGDRDGLGWRTRVRFALAPGGGIGFRAHRSHDVVAVDRCRIAVGEIQDAEVDGRVAARRDRVGAEEVLAVRADDGLHIWAHPGQEPPALRERAAGREWAVAGDGFWQVHPGAADALVAQVLSACAGSVRLWDLYCGVGLFAGALSDDDPRRTIDAVEGDRRAADLARQNLSDCSEVRVHHADVLTWLRRRSGPDARSGRRAAKPKGPDTVVLDPPRKGAGAAVVDLLDRTSAGRCVYIACDPASLGRDTGLLSRAGWRLESVRGLDIFPMTHHVETVAVFAR